MRTIKTMGLVLVAICALSTISATAASAQVGKITSDGRVTLTGTELGSKENRLEAFGLFIECPGSTYTGHEVGSTTNGVLSGSSDATITAHYKQTTAPGAPNCGGPLGMSMTIDLNGCDYVMHLGATTGGVNGTYGVTFDIVCPATKEIIVTLWESEALHTSQPANPFCDVHIKPQIGLAGAHATDSGAGDFVLIGTVAGIHVVETWTHGSKILCPGGTTTNGDLEINATIKGDNSSGTSTSISLSHA